MMREGWWSMMMMMMMMMMMRDADHLLSACTPSFSDDSMKQDYTAYTASTSYGAWGSGSTPAGYADCRENPADSPPFPLPCLSNRVVHILSNSGCCREHAPACPLPLLRACPRWRSCFLLADGGAVAFGWCDLAAVPIRCGTPMPDGFLFPFPMPCRGPARRHWLPWPPLSSFENVHASVRLWAVRQGRVGRGRG
jgi:hypothetical protein